MKQSLLALLYQIVDYAGLFPPAGLDMRSSVENYAGYLESDHAWMLGRFVVPVARLDEFVDAAHPFISRTDHPWRLSAIVGDDVSGDLARAAAFNQTNDGALIDAVEARASAPQQVAGIAELVPGGVRAFVEIPLGGALEPMVEAVAASRLRAKVRTGGVTADAIPSVDDLARFIRRCYASNVPFKATAGLHHPLRSQQPLTYDTEPERATMHGFLNVFLAAAFCYNGIGAVDAPRLLELDDVAEIGFGDDAVEWEGYRVSTAEIERVRRRLARSFGSCSFTEPIAHLDALGLA